VPVEGALSAAASPTPLWPPAARRLLWATIAGIAIYIVLDIVAQLLPPHYSALRQAESDLGVGPYGWVMDVNFVVRGILSFAFVFGLYLAWPKTAKLPRISLALVGAWGVGAFVLAVSPADVSGPATVHGTIHLIAAGLSFLFLAVGVLGLSYAMPAESLWASVRPYAKALAVLTALALVVFFVGTGVPRIEHNLYGLLERVFLGLGLLWMLVVAIHLLRWKPHGPPHASASA
jgi:hypothetical membrane protein